MKIITSIKDFEKKHFNATLIVGIAVGVGVGMFLFSLIVPDPSKITRAYPIARNAEFGNGTGIIMIQDKTSPNMMGNNFRGNVTFSSTRAVPSTILNEKQFLNELVSQYEASVRLAHQALSLEGLSDNSTTLAENIIDNQNAEISVIKDLLSKKTTAKTTVDSNTR